MDHGSHAHWSLPGGEIDVDETPAQTAIRELWEEACLRGEGPILLYERPTATQDETCFLLRVSPDQEPALGIDEDRKEGDPHLCAIAWRPLAGLHDDAQVARVLAALERLGIIS